MLYVFYPYFAPNGAQSREFHHNNCPVRDKLLVENSLSYVPRPVKDAIWVEVTRKGTGALIQAVPNASARKH